jgi:hypothetical protein
MSISSALTFLTTATGSGSTSGASASAFITEAATALSSVIATGLDDQIINSAQIAAQQAIERALAEKDAESAADETSTSQNNTEDKIDFSQKYKDLLEEANSSRVRAAQRKIDSIESEIKRISGNDALNKQDKLRQTGELRLDLIEAELRLFNIQADTTTPKEQANKINNLANKLKVAIDEYTRGTGPTDEEYVLNQYAPITFADEKFAGDAKQLLKDFKSLIRRENISASNIEDLKDRTNVQKSLNNANLKVTKANGLFSDLNDLLDKKRAAAVNITV